MNSLENFKKNGIVFAVKSSELKNTIYEIQNQERNQADADDVR